MKRNGFAVSFLSPVDPRTRGHRRPGSHQPLAEGYANIFRLQAPYSIGFVTYSEGCNDDVNKFIWSSLGWDREKPVVEILRDYSGYFISDRLRDDFAQAVLGLEENWRGPLIANGSVATTLEQFRSMEGAAFAPGIARLALPDGPVLRLLRRLHAGATHP